MTESKSLRAVLRREFREAADEYFRTITDVVSQEARDHRARVLARVALKLHMFEQGRRSARK